MSQLEQLSGIICTPDELAYSLTNPTVLHCLTRGDSLGLLITTLASFMSLIAVCYVFAVILRNSILIYFDPERQHKGLKLFHHPTDILILSLFVADALQAIGGVVNAKWVNSGKVEAGIFCDAQGIVQNVGETAVALSNLTISIYTFFSLWLRKDISSKRLTISVIACIWLFIAIMTAVGNATNKDYESPTPYWCWISEKYLVWRIFAEYLWLWLSLLLSLLVYVPLLWVRNISRDRLHQASVFLAYPLTYCLCILPLSFARWIGIVQEHKYNRNDVPSAAAFFGISVFGLSGFLNVILLLSTRPNCGLFGRLVFEAPRRPPSPTGSEDQLEPQANGVTEERKEESSDDLGRLPEITLSAR